MWWPQNFLVINWYITKPYSSCFPPKPNRESKLLGHCKNPTLDPLAPSERIIPLDQMPTHVPQFAEKLYLDWDLWCFCFTFQRMALETNDWGICCEFYKEWLKCVYCCNVFDSEVSAATESSSTAIHCFSQEWIFLCSLSGNHS